MNKSKRKLYFAFGSNMFTSRMKHRVPSAKVEGVARLDDHCLTFHKRGGDSTGKCSIEESEGDAVWGVLYSIRSSEQHKLDACEGSGYDCVDQYVICEGTRMRAFVYKAKPRAIIEALPREWYRDIVLAGAREHGLPEEYAAQIEAIEAYPDR